MTHWFNEISDATKNIGNIFQIEKIPMILPAF